MSDTSHEPIVITPFDLWAIEELRQGRDPCQLILPDGWPSSASEKTEARPSTRTAASSDGLCSSTDV